MADSLVSTLIRYNAKTGMSQYEDPRGEAAAPTKSAAEASRDQSGGYVSDYAAVDNYSAQEYAGAAALGVDASANLWTQYADDNGIPYW